MKYAVKKFGIVLLCVVVILVGLLVGGMMIVPPPAFGGNMLYGVAFMVLWSATTVYFSARNYRRVSDLQRMTHAWYKATYPQAMKGSITCCFDCGSDRMAIRKMMQKTFHQEHLCVDCGTTLYYSPERT